MRKIFRLATTAAALGAAAWWLRERLLPQPKIDHAPPPAFRTAPKDTSTPDAATPTASDDLKQVKGIGPVYADKLGEMGIRSFGELAAADAAAVADGLDVAESQVADWIEQAADFTG